MKKSALILLFLMLVLHARAQTIREFSNDTALFISELRTFTGTALESSQVPDFERFIQLYDSLSHMQREEVIRTSNLMLNRRCRPRPHFISFQRILLEFFLENKTSHGYDAWLNGFEKLLSDEDVPLRVVDQWLTLSLRLLDGNILYTSNAVTWKITTPAFQFLEEGEMNVWFDDVTMVCQSGKDSIQLLHASGTIDPSVMEWIGIEGRVTWERAGKPENEVYALLNDYTINLSTTGYTADSVSLYYPTVFEGISLGRLEDKVMLIRDPASARYPQFSSYRNTYRITNIAPGVNFQGGLALEGINLIGSGVPGELAVLEFYSRDTLRIRAETARASMTSSYIRSPNTSVSIYIGEDSIFHPDLVLSYNLEQEQLRLNKSEEFTSLGPYSNSYHNMDMNFDELSWNRNESVMKLQAQLGTSVGRATFESNTFFDYQFFMDLQGMDFVHPLAQLYTYSEMLQGRTFAVPNYANYIGFPLYQVRQQLMRLNRLGFVYFDDESDLITLRQKLFDYITSSMGMRDYDVIQFISRTQGAINAELDLNSRDLTIRGIPVIFLSDSQNVRLIPRNNQIVMKRNRSFQFDGVVDAGLFRFTGENFLFDYDRFKINLQDIDSLQLSVFSGQYNQYGESLLTMIDNVIEDMTGELLIDDPDNKSGLKSYPQYPTFTSRGNSYIYFDSKNIQNGVYNRDEFYFELDSFTIDSLDNFRPSSIAPSGRFISAGILPPLQMQMTLRDDNSLGFYMQTAEEGIPLYGGIGTFYNDIEMSSSGLRGFGSLEYLTSTTWSDEFLMHPDSIMARSRRFLIREQGGTIPYPYVENTEADVKLRPADDLMEIARVSETFRIFGDTIFHGGNLALSPDGLSGSGVTALPDARLESDLFHYGERSIRADSASVQLKASAMEEFPFRTDNVNLFVDLDSLMGEITANGDAVLIEFPYNMYETRLDQVSWFMDRDEVKLTQRKTLPENDVDIGIDSLKTNGPTYLSTHPLQDSLNFVAPEATYDYSARILHSSTVPFIAVADAYVIPDKGVVDIGYQATMSMLENATIIANQENRQHLIRNAEIAVNGAKDYSGSGYYDYRDAFGNSYPVYFDRIWVDTTLETRSRGNVAEDESFMMSPFFDFTGSIQLVASDPFLLFDGGTRIVHDCNIRKEWLRFTSRIDPSNIEIPVEERMRNTALNNIYAGSLITRDSTHIYAAFLSGRKDYFDANITSADGILIYDPERERYIISSPEKVADSTLPGKYLRLERSTCTLYGEGPIDLTVDYGQVKLTAAGNATHRVESDEFTTHIVMGIDFMFSPEALIIMGSEIDSLPDLEPADLSSPHYRLAMRDLLGIPLAAKLERELALTGAYEEIPDSWRHTIFFNDLTLAWNQETRSFRYNGKVGIGNIGDIQVNKKVDAYIELVERGSGDVFDIYLQVDRNTWYYLAYSPGGLQVLSSNSNFNQTVFDLNANDRRIRAQPGEAQYVYSLAAQRRLDLFLQRFREIEEGGEGEVF